MDDESIALAHADSWATGAPRWSKEHVLECIAAARADDRERCAKVCEELAELNRETCYDSMWQWGECAAAIRALTGDGK